MLVDEVAERLRLSADGREVPLRFVRPGRVTFPAGAGGLRTSRFEFDLRARVHSPSRVSLRDETFPDRVGWKAIVARPGEGTAVRTDAPSGDPTVGLRRYPQDFVLLPVFIGVTFLMTFVKAYALATVHHHKWLTRQVEVVNDTVVRSGSDQAAQPNRVPFLTRAIGSAIMITILGAVQLAAWAIYRVVSP